MSMMARMRTPTNTSTTAVTRRANVLSAVQLLAQSTHGIVPSSASENSVTLPIQYRRIDRGWISQRLRVNHDWFQPLVVAPLEPGLRVLPEAAAAAPTTERLGVRDMEEGAYWCVLRSIASTSCVSSRRNSRNQLRTRMHCTLNVMANAFVQ